MARFLLVHGSCHGAWCWRDLIPELEARGHTAHAIELPGHGNDGTRPEDSTLEACGRAVLDGLKALGGPAVVVGHSWGGYPITQAAELDPSNIARLIYLCAYVPRSGHSLVDMRMLADRQPLLPALRRSEDGVTASFDAAMAPDLFYHDCPEEAVAFAGSRLKPQPITPQRTPLEVTDRSRTLPRSYIRCAEDRAIPPEFQTVMAADFAPEDRQDMPCSHSPFFAAPGDLAARLDALATRSPGAA